MYSSHSLFDTVQRTFLFNFFLRMLIGNALRIQTFALVNITAVIIIY